jgi:choline kinase
MLDSRAPPQGFAQEEKELEDHVEQEVQRLMSEARLWRAVNSAQWVAWGVVQAKVAGMDEGLERERRRRERHESVQSGSSTATSANASSPLAFMCEPDSSSLASYAAMGSPPTPMTDPISPELQSAVGAVHDKRPEGLVAEALADGNEMSHDLDDEEEFDYLAYAQERALFFWGDVLEAGVVKEDMVKGWMGGDMWARVKRVRY